MQQFLAKTSMPSRITSILPLILISLLSLSGVEMFYLAMERLLLAAESDQSRAGIVDRATLRAPASSPAFETVADPSIIVDRNLFGVPEENSREEAAVEDSHADLQPTSLDLVLMGIVDGGTEDRRAVILTKKDKRQEMYQVGDMVAGARIKTILWGRVVLQADGRDEVLDMSEAVQYRAGAVAGQVSAGAPVSSREQLVVSSAGSEFVDQLIPERVRLVLPNQESGGPENGE